MLTNKFFSLPHQHEFPSPYLDQSSKRASLSRMWACHQQLMHLYLQSTDWAELPVDNFNEFVSHLITMDAIKRFGRKARDSVKVRK